MSRKRLTRQERLATVRAILTGLISGTARAVVTCLLNQLTS